MSPPRILAAMRPARRKFLASYDYLLVCEVSPKAIEGLEDYEPGSTNPRLRKVGNMSLIARLYPPKPSWLTIWTNSEEAAVFARITLGAVPIPNPNTPGQIGLDDPAAIKKLTFEGSEAAVRDGPKRKETVEPTVRLDRRKKGEPETPGKQEEDSVKPWCPKLETPDWLAALPPLEPK